MSALECPCRNKGGGVLHDPSCWLLLDVGWRGATHTESFFFFKWILSLTILSVIPCSSFPINRDMTSPTGMHMQAGLFHAHTGHSYSMPFLSIWLAAMSMTLMMNAMAKAQMRLFLTHVWRFFFEGWTEKEGKKRRKKRRTTSIRKTVPQVKR